jgi:hypothetical protein
LQYGGVFWRQPQLNTRCNQIHLLVSLYVQQTASTAIGYGKLKSIIIGYGNESKPLG